MPIRIYIKIMPIQFIPFGIKSIYFLKKRINLEICLFLSLQHIDITLFHPDPCSHVIHQSKIDRSSIIIYNGEIIYRINIMFFRSNKKISGGRIMRITNLDVRKIFIQVRSLGHCGFNRYYYQK